jgi:hypothetical protein
MLPRFGIPPGTPACDQFGARLGERIPFHSEEVPPLDELEEELELELDEDELFADEPLDDELEEEEEPVPEMSGPFSPGACTVKPAAIWCVVRGEHPATASAEETSHPSPRIFDEANICAPDPEKNEVFENRISVYSDLVNEFDENNFI